MTRLLKHSLCAALLCFTFVGTLLVTPTAEARQNIGIGQQTQLTASQAAKMAKARHGGKVLKVVRQGNDFKVRLLQKSGHIVTVKIKG